MFNKAIYFEREGNLIKLNSKDFAGELKFYEKKVISWLIILSFLLISCVYRSKECWVFSEEDERIDLIINDTNVELKSSKSDGIFDLGYNEMIKGSYDTKNNIILFDTKSITMKITFKSRNKMDLILEDGMILSLLDLIQNYHLILKQKCQKLE